MILEEMPEYKLNKEIAYADTYGTITCSVMGVELRIVTT